MSKTRYNRLPRVYSLVLKLDFVIDKLDSIILDNFRSRLDKELTQKSSFAEPYCKCIENKHDC